MNEVLVAYIPVLDKGYLDFIRRNYYREVFIFGNNIVSEFDHLRKDLRRTDPQDMRIALKAVTGSELIEVLDHKRIEEIRKSGKNILMPDEDVTRALAEKYFTDDQVRFEVLGLRYDSKKTLEEKVVQPNCEMTSEVFSVKIMGFLEERAKKSLDWWRQIGAALVKDGEVVFWAINKPTPDEYVLSHMGDPRFNFKKGQYVEFSNVLHAEAAIVARAAKCGVSTEGTDVYTTTFPCPPCSRVLAHTGIKRLFFKEGYAMLDGDIILRSQNIQIIKVV